MFANDFRKLALVCAALLVAYGGGSTADHSRSAPSITPARTSTT